MWSVLFVFFSAWFDTVYWQELWAMRPAYKTCVTYSKKFCSGGSEPAVLWHCWLGVRRSIRPVKRLTDEVLAWLSVWSEVQMICIWSSWCHCHPVISCFIKIQTGLPFRYCLTLVVLEKWPLTGCLVSVCLSVCLSVPEQVEKEDPGGSRLIPIFG